MDLENRFRRTWKRFQEVLKTDYNCSLADVCREQHTTFGGMSSWMSRRGYSVKQAKADVVRDYYGGVEPSPLSTTSPAFTQIAREIHVFSNISQSILSVPGLCSYEPWHRRFIQNYTLGNEGLVSRFRRYIFILWQKPTKCKNTALGWRWLSSVLQAPRGWKF